jgi:hypothetical protein
MPDSKYNIKLSGDTHPPEVEDEQVGSAEGRADAQGEAGTAPEEAFTRDVDNEERAAKSLDQAGKRKGKNAKRDKP